jgi:hypothetical protein
MGPCRLLHQHHMLVEPNGHVDVYGDAVSRHAMFGEHPLDVLILRRSNSTWGSTYASSHRLSVVAGSTFLPR